jgi:homogentisate 1,2-dioxygenase
MGLYAEQLSGTAFTAPRSHGAGNQCSWLYRIHPSVMHSRFVKTPQAKLVGRFTGSDTHIDPNQFRWPPLAIPTSASTPVNFVQGLVTMAGAGDAEAHNGLAIHLYACSASMTTEHSCFCNADGDMLIVPQTGTIVVTTEFGVMRVEPCEICVVQRGMKFAVDVLDGAARGYVLEILKGHFVLPDLGPIGANGLANPRDFETPVAAFVDSGDEEHVFYNKFGGHLWRATTPHNPFDVVGWHGNYAPYKYDLRKFMCINSVCFDHPDPSIYTVLSCLSDEPGVAIADFVIFPPRWMVMEHTFRPPYYHRNIMSEYMGQIWGAYDAKVGFIPGASSLHSCMTPHGPDAPTFEGASAAALAPEYFGKGLAFMFETCLTLRLTDHAVETADLDYPACWDGLQRHFDPSIVVPEGTPAGPVPTVGAAAAAHALTAQAAQLAAAVAK